MIGLALWIGLANAQNLDIAVDYVVPGETTTLTVNGANPGESVRFVRSFQGVGAGPCPAVLGGLCLDLRGTTLMGASTANGEGQASFQLSVPASAPLGNAVSFQAAIARGPGGANSVKTDVVADEVAESFTFTATVDGDASEYPPESWFQTTGGSWAVVYDNDFLYVAVANPDVGASAEHWVVMYFGDSASEGFTGVLHNTQQPGLAAPAHTALRWKSDGSYNGFLDYDLAQGWLETPDWLGTNGSEVAWSANADVVEFKIPLSAVGPKSFTMQASWVFEGSGFESTYSGLPAGSIQDGYDPDFSAALSINRRSSYAPAQQ
jgi:hypothetical protein